ncbi:MAG: HAMP domain-containing protein [Bacteroidales bacterium]|nr:HAMP domain-containing protein [Bacteroidales bacterium]
MGFACLVGVQEVHATTLTLNWVQTSITIAIMMGVVALVITYRIARQFIQPSEQLAEGVRCLMQGDFGHTIPVAGGREFSTLTESFNTMSERLAATFGQLDRDREHLRTILLGMIEGVIAVDNEQRVLFANERAAEFLEFVPEQAVGRKLWEVTRQRAVQRLVEKTLSHSGPYREELDWKGPTVKSLDVYVARLPGPHSPGAVLVLHDITDLRRLERLRQDFVANVSHELKTPLANIKSSVEVLLDGAVEDPALRGGFLHEISDQANRLDDLIQDLLVLARIESGESGLELETVEVEEAVHECLDRHRTRAEAKRLNLSGVALAACPSDLAIIAHDEAIARILDNLVDNSIKYTPPGGRITVRWDSGSDSVCIEVADTGIGIPERDQPRVFERFYRVDKARSREMGGTGLGLSIVKHLVQAMKGTIQVSSVLGCGTTFRVCFPRAVSSTLP